MIAFSAFYDHLMPELPGATTALVDLHLLHVARDFCERTSAWRYTWQQGTTADQPTYDISQPELQSELVRVTRLAVNDLLLWDDAWRDHRQGEGEDAPKYDRAEPPFTMNEQNTELTLITDEVPSSAADDGLALTAALKPAFSATKLPEFLKSEQLEALRAGTLARLMRMGGKPWTDRDLAVFNQNEYTRLMNAAANRAQLGNTKQRLRTRQWG